jgi:predicted Ser/Thr protein kinase
MKGCGQVMEDKQIGDYKILKHIGSGGMAKVYLAVHKDVPNLKVVLKILSHSQHTDRFKQEADKLALLDNNPHICKIRHFFNHGDDFVIAMDYIDGPSLDEILAKTKEIPVPDALRMVIDIVTALEPAHAKEIFHRDIKPSNIMFTKDGDLKIIDFGIAKGKSDPQLTIVGTAAGTPEYMAPEQFEAREDIDYSRCDLYAIATMLYRMLTGEMPFKGANEFVLRDAKLFDNPTPPSKLNHQIGKELDGIILKSIRSNPDERFGSISELKAELQVVYDKLIKSKPAGPSPKPSPPKPSKGLPKAIKLGAGLLAIIAAAVIVIKLLPGGGTPAGREVTGLEATGLDGASRETTTREGAGRLPTDTIAAATAAARETTATALHRPVAAPPDYPKPVLAPGTLTVGSRPRGGDIYINGKLQKESTPFRFSLPPGRYTVKIVLPGGQEYVETVTIISNQEARIMYRPE